MLIETAPTKSTPKPRRGDTSNALYCDAGINQIFNLPPARLMLTEFFCAAPTAL